MSEDRLLPLLCDAYDHRELRTPAVDLSNCVVSATKVLGTSSEQVQNLGSSIDTVRKIGGSSATHKN